MKKTARNCARNKRPNLWAPPISIMRCMRQLVLENARWTAWMKRLFGPLGYAYAPSLHNLYNVITWRVTAFLQQIVVNEWRKTGLHCAGTNVFAPSWIKIMTLYKINSLILCLVNQFSRYRTTLKLLFDLWYRLILDDWTRSRLTAPTFLRRGWCSRVPRIRHYHLVHIDRFAGEIGCTKLPRT